MKRPDQSYSNEKAHHQFADLLPTTFSPPVERIGSVQSDTINAKVIEGRPRYRGGGRLANLLFHPVLGWERYIKEQRSSAIGKAAIYTWGAPEETERLTINEARYTPVKPAYGDETPLTHLQAEYVLSGSMDDRGTVRTSGISFDFLQVSDVSSLHAKVSPYLLSSFGGGHSQAITFLEEHNFNTDTYKLGPQIVDLAKLCIQLAQESES